MTMTAPASAPAGPARPPVLNGPPAGDPDKDSIHLVPTLIGMVAILAGSSALTVAVKGSSWVLPLVEVVAVVWLVGIGGRLIRVPAAVTVLMQLIGMAIALTSLFTTGGIGGVIPNPAAVHEAGVLLSGAWHQILVTTPPAPSTAELSFLIALAVGAAAVIVDFLIAQARAPALIALPLLCLYSVPASIATELLPWYTFVAPAALYAMLLAVSGHRSRNRAARVGVGLAASGIAITVVATLLAVTVADSVTAVGTAGRLPRTGTGSGEVGLSPFTSLHGNLQRSDPVDLLVVTGLQEADYLREIALETWTDGQGFSAGTITPDVPGVSGPIPGLDAAKDAARQVSVQSVQLKDKYLPIYSGTTGVNGLTGGWNYDRSLSTIFRSDAVNPQQYSITATFAEPQAADLDNDAVTPGGILTETGALPRRVVTQAQQVTAGKTSAFAKADALLDWFKNPTNGFRYSLNVPTGNTGNALTDFLENKQGYCEQYASAMAIMLRSLGIPARVAVGYTQGSDRGDGSYLITSHDAHAWVEVLFNQAGWVRFDPTPLAGTAGGVQGFVDGSATGGTATTSTETTSTTETDTGGVLPAQSNRPDGGVQQPDGGVTTAADAAAAPTGLAKVPATLWWILGILLVLAAIAVAPSLVRNGRRRRRLSLAAGGGPGSAAAAWAEIEDLAIDHGIPLRPSESARATANRLARSGSLAEDGRARLRQLVMAAEREWYGMPAANGADVDLVGAVKAMSDGLHQSSPLVFADKLVPRSVRPSSRD